MKGSYFSFRFHTHLIKVSMIFLDKRVIGGFFTPFLVSDRSITLGNSGGRKALNRSVFVYAAHNLLG